MERPARGNFTQFLETKEIRPPVKERTDHSEFIETNCELMVIVGWGLVGGRGEGSAWKGLVEEESTPEDVES